jgi:hypothetical protein
MELADAMTAARSTNFRDRVPRFGASSIDWDDPVERVAILLHAFRFMTPDDAASSTSAPAGRAELAVSWRNMEPAGRQLWRRRAWMAIDVADTGDASAVATGDASTRKDWG